MKRIYNKLRSGVKEKKGMGSKYTRAHQPSIWSTTRASPARARPCGEKGDKEEDPQDKECIVGRMKEFFRTKNADLLTEPAVPGTELPQDGVQFSQGEFWPEGIDEEELCILYLIQHESRKALLPAGSYHYIQWPGDHKMPFKHFLVQFCNPWILP